MDKNTSIGLVLCFAILAGFWWLNKPSEEDKAKWARYYDSLAAVQAEADSLARASADSLARNGGLDSGTVTSDSAAQAQRAQKYGLLGDATQGEEQQTVLENDLLRVYLTNVGGKIANVELKGYEAYGGRPLLVYGSEEKTHFGFDFVHNNRSYNTDELHFSTTGVEMSNDSTQELRYTLRLGNGHLDYTWTLTRGSYSVGLTIAADSVGDKLSTQHSNIDLQWSADMPAQEKSHKSEALWSNVAYRYADGDVEELSTTGQDSKQENLTLDWVAYKNQFFSAILQARSGFAGAQLESQPYEEHSDVVKHTAATLGVKFDFRDRDQADFQFLFVPNYFYTLDSYEGMNLTQLLPLSWGIFRWINEYFIIPVFKFLENAFTNYGIIILLLTFLIKLIIFPMTYSSFKSQAKMRVLKPQVDAINEKIPAEKAIERQQATMALYKKAGVSPMSGCLPMLLQMPIIFAAFRFFPAAIEFRGKAFLWADDLSTYDSILDLPFSIPFYGAHVSLFCLLMCGIQVLYTHFTMQTQNTGTMPGMKYMMYFMPVMMLFFFNDYPAALCYYYFLSSLFTVVQTIVIKRTIDEKAILAKIEQNQKKPQKKGRLQTMYEKKMKELEAQQRQQRRRK